MDVTIEQLQHRLMDCYEMRRSAMKQRNDYLQSRDTALFVQIEHNILEVNNLIDEIRHEILSQQLASIAAGLGNK